MKLLTSDKAIHFLSCYFLASIWWPLGIGIAIGKEVWDWYMYGRFTKGFWKMALEDIIFDTFGIIFAILI